METKEKRKFYYSRNEKIVRAIAILGIILSEVIGVLLLVLGRTLNGIIVFCACAVASFLVSSFFIGIVKNKLCFHEKRRVFYALIYAGIIILAMLTAFLASYFSTYGYEEIREPALTFVHNAIKKDNVNVTVVDSTVVSFEQGESYYMEVETTITVKEVGGAVTTKTVLSYIKVNIYTAEITAIDWQQYQIASTYID